MQTYGMPDWFRLGDRDLATHITRANLLRSGHSLSEVTRRLAGSLGVKSAIPATDETVRTKIETATGMLDFQEFFVRERCRPEVRSVAYAGATEAHGHADALHSIRESQLVIGGSQQSNHQHWPDVGGP